MKISIRYVVVQTATGQHMNVRHSLHQAVEDCENMDRCHISREIKVVVDDVLTVISVHDIYIPIVSYAQALQSELGALIDIKA